MKDWIYYSLSDNVYFENYVLDEANRCLICKKPRCKENCPIRTAIPEIIALYREGNIDKAGKILFENNPLSLICSIVCSHENQCFGNCIKRIKGEAIKFYDIERIRRVLRYRIPKHRLPKKIIDKYEEKLVEIGVKIRPNTLIGPVITIDRLFEEGYKAIFIVYWVKYIFAVE